MHSWTARPTAQNSPGLSEAVDLVLLRRAIDTFGALALGCGLFLGLGMLMSLPETKLVLRYRRRS